MVGTKWIPKLWKELGKIKKKRKDELDKINTIMFGDPLELAKYYVEPDCQEMNPADCHEEDPMVAKVPIMKKIEEFFNIKSSFHQGSNQLFILSDAGMGKSALLTMLKLMHMTAFLPQNKNFELKKLDRKTIQDIKKIKNKRETVLLLDSLDEDPMAFGKVRDRLLDILDESQHFFKVIITCRTQFFPKTEKDPMELPGRVSIEGYSCYSKYLSFFDDDKVIEYLSKRFPRKFGLLPDKKKIDEAREIIDKMGSLRCRPMLLSYIDDLRESPLTKGDNSEYKIYDVLVQSWLKREKIKMPDISEQDLLHSCIILATYMQTKKVRSISEDKLDRLVGKISEVKAVKEIEIKGRSLLNKNSEGDYRFSHYSIQEFLVAKLLLEEPIYKPKQTIPLTEFIFKMVTASLDNVLNFPELLDCRGLNLREANLQNFKLPDANLSGVDLQGADLRFADLRGADLRGANLYGALIEGIQRLEGEYYPLRSEPATVSNEDFRRIFRLNENRRPIHYVENKFEDHGDTITDHTTNLMWQKSGSDRMIFSNALNYINELNHNKFAGYDDWRLPTIDELVPLLEEEKKNGLYIDPVFDKKQRWCWSSDKRASGGAWSVYFNGGSVDWSYLDLYNYVRGVRSRTM